MSGADLSFLNDDLEELPVPTEVAVRGVMYRCVGLWDDCKDGARRGGYVLELPAGGHWAIDYANPALGSNPAKETTPGVA